MIGRMGNNISFTGITGKATIKDEQGSKQVSLATLPGLRGITKPGSSISIQRSGDTLTLLTPKTTIPVEGIEIDRVNRRSRLALKNVDLNVGRVEDMGNVMAYGDVSLNIPQGIKNSSIKTLGQNCRIQTPGIEGSIVDLGGENSQLDTDTVLDSQIHVYAKGATVKAREVRSSQEIPAFNPAYLVDRYAYSNRPVDAETIQSEGLEQVEANINKAKAQYSQDAAQAKAILYWNNPATKIILHNGTAEVQDANSGAYLQEGRNASLHVTNLNSGSKVVIADPKYVTASNSEARVMEDQRVQNFNGGQVMSARRDGQQRLHAIDKYWKHRTKVEGSHADAYTIEPLQTRRDFPKVYGREY